MMDTSVNNRCNGMRKAGIAIFGLYIFASFLANDVLLPKTISSFTLYLFLGYSLLYVFLNKKLVIHKISMWLLSYMAFSLLTMLYSPEKDIFSGQFYTMIINFILILLLSQYSIDEKIMCTIGRVYMLSSALMMIALIITGNIVDFSESGRLGEELVGNANAFAIGVMFATLFAIWLLVYHSSDAGGKFIAIVCILLNYFGMFMSGGRKYIMVPLVFFYILLIYKQDRKGRKHFFKYTAMILAMALVMYWIVMNVPTFYDIIGIRIEAFLSFLNGDIGNTDASTIVRNKMIEGGLQGWLSSPIWGYGFDSFKYYNVTITGYEVYSHNNFVELLYNGGIIGFCLFYWFYGKILHKAWHNKTRLSMQAQAFSVAVIAAILCYEFGEVTYISLQCMLMLFFADTILHPTTNNIENDNGIMSPNKLS